ncbi:helix-turn-helix transcriptional regulator [Macrococcus epidermidis]|uniref:helix-turn-helix transcriptional regulator n=1 Tax=Macrococcus epidermidis TaxID=1902580 RepID=UPI001EF2ED5D|nr:helix-turn-helix transcriptional regulator [Macrococcus epidermidis]MCG7420995.1 helix-turn-helix transcriptional regulator [Macrococcus epidermidis]
MNYHKQIDDVEIDDYMLEDDGFFNLVVVSDVDYNEALEQVTNIADSNTINVLIEKVQEVATEREEAIFLCFLQGKDIVEIKRIFMIGEAMINKHLDRVIDKVIEGSH